MSVGEGYSAIANIYDKLNEEIDYVAWADFIESCFDRYLPEKPKLVLDLACGTGRMTRELDARGYDMIGVDASEEMLGVAYEKSQGRGILYLCQSMQSFELYGTVGAVVCCLDSINYLLRDGELEQTFATVHNYLDPDGLFLFDANTPYKFEKIYGDNAYILEDEDEDGAGVLCAWQNAYDAQSGICDFYLSVFSEDSDGRYLRADEQQSERCYGLEKIKSALEGAGFELAFVCGDFEMSAPKETCERWYIGAIAKK